MINVTAGTAMNEKPFQNKLQYFLQNWNELQPKTKDYLHACYLVHMIRVLSAFCGDKEFLQEAITKKGYDLLKRTKYGAITWPTKVPNFDQISYSITQTYVDENGSDLATVSKQLAIQCIDKLKKNGEIIGNFDPNDLKFRLFGQDETFPRKFKLFDLVSML